MIKVVKNKNVIMLSGHAGSNIYGKDIVCASVSSIVYTTINAIARIRKSALLVEDKEDLTIKVIENDEIVDALIDNMMELLKAVSKDYPKNINVKES